MKKSILPLSVILVLAIATAWQIPYQQSVDSTPVGQDTLSINCPDNIKAILERSCYDCHSNTAGNPVSKGKLNFSNWGEYTSAKKISKLEKICTEITENKMPKKKYLKKHPESKLSDADVTAICEWTQAESKIILGE